MTSDTQTFNASDFRKQLEEELTSNILPFWMTHVVDRVNGGFYGAVTNDLQIRNEVPRSAILCARILWTYSAAYRRLGGEQYLSMAQWAYDYLNRVFWDQEYGGLYWQVDRNGTPVADRKHHYAQAFGIYGLSEYYRATRDSRSLELARELFGLLEEHAYDPANQGYLEGSDRAWRQLADTRLSDRDLECRKSMNTMLHILEAYTNLLRAWDDKYIRAQLGALLRTFQRQIVDPRTGHLRLFFDDQWHLLSESVSFGHDIEGSWLLWEAAEVLGNPGLQEETRRLAVVLADAVLRDGLDTDGSLFSKGTPQGVLNSGKDWWPQAEGIVGFYNAYQLTGDERFAEAAIRCWQTVQDRFVDRAHGDWFKRLSPDGTPDPMSYKAGPWDCPYHHSRACLEMLDRLDEPG